MPVYKVSPEDVRFHTDASTHSPIMVSCCPTSPGGRKLYGINALNGNVYSAYPQLPALFLFYNRGAVIKDEYDIDHIGSARAVVSGLARLLKDGKRVELPENPYVGVLKRSKCCPRSAIGINHKGELVIIAGDRLTIEDICGGFSYLGVKDALLVSVENTYLEKGGKVVCGKEAPPLLMGFNANMEFKRPLILIDPGHGGNDPGASGNGLKEKDLNLAHAKNVARYLSGYDCTVLLTRYEDVTASLHDRAVISRVLKPDLFVSIHTNAGGGTGFESFIRIDASEASIQAHQIIHNQLAAHFANMGMPDRGRKREDWSMCMVDAKASILVELLFVDNEKDVRLLKDAGWFGTIGANLAAGIARYLNLVPAEEVKPEKPKLYRVQVGAFKNRDNALRLVSELKVKGYDPYIVEQ